MGLEYTRAEANLSHLNCVHLLYPLTGIWVTAFASYHCQKND